MALDLASTDDCNVRALERKMHDERAGEPAATQKDSRVFD